MYVYLQIRSPVKNHIIIDIEDVNKALKEVKIALDTKTCENDLQEVVKDQATIN